jgi:hypothetical protein
MNLRRPRLRTLAALIIAAPALVVAPAAAAPTCTAQSPAYAVPVVELYTSEGCNSCPPADRWLSKLKGDAGIVALAFHVDYWDRLGWKDRFASPDYTRRQAQQQASNGARFSYTPQVVVDGIDRPDWRSRAAPDSQRGRAQARVQIVLSRDGRRVSASVWARAGAPDRLAAFWAVTENDHRSDVKAGENSGVSLHHDFVVRAYEAVSAWTPRAEAPTTLQFDAASASAQPAHVNLVVVDAATGRPLQAAKLGC